MSNIGVKQGYPTLFGLYCTLMNSYLNEINMDSPCLFNTMVAILLFADDVVLLSILGANLQRPLNKLYEYCTSSSLEVNLAKTKVMIFAHNKKKLNQKAFYLEKEQIEIADKYKYLRIDIYSHDYFEPSVKGEEWQVWKRWWEGKEAIIDVTCWELKSHLFKALVLPTFTYDTEIWGGDLKNSHWKVFEKGIEMYMTSHVKVHSSTTYHILLAEYIEPPIELYALKLTMVFQQYLPHLFPLLASQ